MFFIVGLSSGCTLTSAQGISVYVAQDLNFGTFLQGKYGGTVTIYPNGTRSITGDLMPITLNMAYFQAIFEIVAPTGTIISILNESDVVLTGSNGGYITLHIDNSEPSSPFIINVPYPERTRVNVGGTITVGNPLIAKAGLYSGTFSIIFNQE